MSNLQAPVRCHGPAILAVLVCVWMAAPGHAQPNPSGERHAQVLRLMLNTWMGAGPLHIAKEKGLLGGLQLEFEWRDDVGGRRSMMMLRQVDGYVPSVDALASDAAHGVTGKIVLCLDESFGADGLVAKSNLTIKDLKGRTIGVQQQMTGHFLLLSILSDHGLSASDVLIRNAQFPHDGFIAGNYDAAVTWEPWLTNVAKYGRVLRTTADMPGVIVDVLVLRNEVVESRPDDVRRLVHGWYEALRWYQSHRQEAEAIIGKAYRQPVSAVRNTLSGIRFCDRERNRELMGRASSGGLVQELFDRASRLWREVGVVHQPAQSRDYIDPSWVR